MKVHEKEPKPGCRKAPEPVDSSILFGGMALILAVLGATETSAATGGVQRWMVRFLTAVVLLIVHTAWQYNRKCKAPLTVHVAVASPVEAARLPADAKVEDLVGGLLARQLPADERRERTIALLAAAGFQGTGDAKLTAKTCVENGVRCGDLSESQRRVVQTLMCIAQRPEVLVCDEALVGLPIDNQARLLKMVKRMKQECKTSVLVMSSDLDQVSYIADSLGLVCPEGELLEKGPTLEVLETPRHEETQKIMAEARKGAIGRAGPIQAQCKELIGDRALEASWLPPKYT